MYEHLPQTGSQAVIYRNAGVIYTESLAAPYVHLLEQIRDKTGTLSMIENGLTADESRDFITFALQEGILVKC
jgi:hypothetical protein